jgi:ubiquinone/menaquinone biosynthesis C-methylase UbiE
MADSRYTETWEEIFADEAGSYSMEDLLTRDPYISVKHSHYISSVLDKVDPAAKILEAGCGRGQWVIYLGQEGYDCVGVDLAFRAMARSRKEFPYARFIAGDINTLCLKDSSFDVILCWSVIDHIEQGPEQALREMRRVLRPGGKIFITVPCRNILASALQPLRYIRDRVKQNALVRAVFKRPLQPPHFFQHEFTRKRFARHLIDTGFALETMLPFSHDVGFAGAVNNVLFKGSKAFHKNRIGGWKGLTRTGRCICGFLKSMSRWLTPDEIFAVAVKR